MYVQIKDHLRALFPYEQFGKDIQDAIYRNTQYEDRIQSLKFPQTYYITSGVDLTLHRLRPNAIIVFHTTLPFYCVETSEREDIPVAYSFTRGDFDVNDLLLQESYDKMIRCCERYIAGDNPNIIKRIYYYDAEPNNVVYIPTDSTMEDDSEMSSDEFKQKMRAIKEDKK